MHDAAGRSPKDPLTFWSNMSFWAAVAAVIGVGFAAYVWGEKLGRRHEAELRSAFEASKPIVHVPQTTVNDFLLLSPADRAIFMRGYLLAKTSWQSGRYLCEYRWYYEGDGRKALEEYVQTTKPDESAPPDDFRRKSVVLVFAMLSPMECPTKK